MTDGERFILVQKTKKDIEKMGLSIEIFHGRQIQIGSDNFSVFWEKNRFEVAMKSCEMSMDEVQWETFSTEIANLYRAIIWINRIKNVILN